MPSFEAIVEALKSPLEAQRERAVQALVRSRDVRAVELLQRVVSEDESVAVRYLAKKGLFYLRKGLGEEGAADVPEEGAAAPSGLEAKLKAILEKGSDAQKIKLLRGLTSKKLTKALPILKVHPIEADNPEVRSNYVLTIGILGGENELSFVKDFLEDEDPRVRANTVEALEFLGTPKAYPLVVKTLSDPDNRIRANAIKALRHYGKVNCLALLGKMMEGKKLWMRDSAAYALSLLGGEDSLPLLVKAMKDPEPSVQDKARKGLERLADKGIRDAAEALRNFPKDRGEHSVEAFFEEDGPEMSFVVPEDDPLHADDPQERLRAVTEIVETRATDRMDDLMAAARGEGDGFVRAKMVIELGRLGGADLVQELQGFLKDPMDRVRANAVEAMAMADRDAAQPLLVGMLEDKNNRVRANAVVALRDYEHVSVVPCLRNMLGSPEVLMRKSAFYAITEVDTDEVGPLVEQLLSDEDEDLRQKARGFVEMSAADGIGWALEIQKAREGAGEPDEGPVDFEEFAAQEEADEDADSKALMSRASAEGAREKLARFRGLDVEGKRMMIEEAKNDIGLESYFFLREAVEDANFEIKIQAKMALRNFDEDFIQVADEDTGLEALFRPPEVQTMDYKGMKQATELTKDLNTRIQTAEQRGYWEGPFPTEYPILNALRDDTRENLQAIIAGEEIDRVFLCYQNDRLAPFRQGKKSLDSNRYSTIVGLGQATSRVAPASFHGTFMHTLKRPIYLLALCLESRLVLFLRGWFETTRCAYVEVAWPAIDQVEAEKVGDVTSVKIQVMGELVEIPELAPDEAKWIYDRAKEREESKMGHAIDDASREIRKLDLLRSGGVITEREYQTRRSVLDKSKKKK